MMLENQYKRENSELEVIDKVTDMSKIIYLDFLHELKNEHNLMDTINELEKKYFTTYLYILKNVFMYCSKPSMYKGSTAYKRINDWEDFSFSVKSRAKNLIININ